MYVILSEHDGPRSKLANVTWLKYEHISKSWYCWLIQMLFQSASAWQEKWQRFVEKICSLMIANPPSNCMNNVVSLELNCWSHPALSSTLSCSCHDIRWQLASFPIANNSSSAFFTSTFAITIEEDGTSVEREPVGSVTFPHYWYIAIAQTDEKILRSKVGALTINCKLHLLQAKGVACPVVNFPGVKFLWSTMRFWMHGMTPPSLTLRSSASVHDVG